MEYAWPKTLEQHLHSLFSLARVLSPLIARPLERRSAQLLVQGICKDCSIKPSLTTSESTGRIDQQCKAISSPASELPPRAPAEGQPLRHLGMLHLPKAGTQRAKAVLPQHAPALASPPVFLKKLGKICFSLAMLLSYISS